MTAQKPSEARERERERERERDVGYFDGVWDMTKRWGSIARSARCGEITSTADLGAD